MPKKLQNTVSEYYIAKRDLIGHVEEPKEDYDLIDIIMIRRGDESSDEQILDYLNNLMKADLSGIRTYSNIEWPEELEKEGDYMLGFADSLLRQEQKVKLKVRLGVKPVVKLGARQKVKLKKCRQISVVCKKMVCLLRRLHSI